MSDILLCAAGDGGLFNGSNIHGNITEKLFVQQLDVLSKRI